MTAPAPPIILLVLVLVLVLALGLVLVLVLVLVLGLVLVYPLLMYMGRCPPNITHGVAWRTIKGVCCWQVRRVC